VSGAGTLTKAGAGALTLSGSNTTFTGGVTLNAGTLNVQNGNGLGTGPFSFNGTASIDNVSFNGTLNVYPSSITWGSDFTYLAAFGNAANLTMNAPVTLTGNRTATINLNGGASPTNTFTFFGAIGGSGGFTKAGAGTLALVLANTYTGKTVINAGLVSLTDENRLGGAPVSFTADQITLNGGGILAPSGSFSFNSNRGITLGASGGTFNIVSGSTVTLASVITGSGALTKAGVGTLSMTGAHTYTGATIINAGTLQLASNNNRLPTATALTIASGATFNINGRAQTIGSLAGAGSVSNGSTPLATLTVGDATSTTHSGVISTALVSLTKVGAGTLTLSGTNTYTGVTTINAGILSVSSIGNGGVSGNIGAATNAAANLVMGGGTLQYTGATASTDRNFTLTAATTNTFDITVAANTLTLSGSSTNTTGGITKAGAGTLVLTGTNLNTGVTTVSAGTLQLNKSGGGTMPNTGSITVNSGATLRISTDQTLASVTVDVGGTLIVDATLTITGTATINGTFQINQGGYGTGGTWTYGSSSTLVYNNTSGSYGPITSHPYWPSTNGPVNVTVQGGGGINMGDARTVSGTFLLVTGTNAVQGIALTLNGTVQINGGNFQSSPIYGSSSLLKYNVNATYGRNNEWVATGVGTIGTTAGYPNNVQLSNNTTLNFPNGSNDARACARDLTIDAGSNLYADFSSGSVNLTVGRNISIAGGISLGGSSGGDLTVGGNFTRTGTFTPNGRAAYFNASSGDQTITGATTFPFVIVDKTAGNVVLANDITCTGTLTLTNGKISTGSNKVIISSTGSISRTNGWVIGFLQKNAATGATTRTFEIGDATNYTPLSISFGNVTTQGDVTATVAAVAHPNFNSSTLNQTKYAQRYWTLSNASTAFDTYDATFTYVSGDLQGGASGASLNVGRYASAAWTYPTSSNSGSTTTATGLTAFGDFMLAEQGCINPTAFTVTGGGAYCSGGTGVAIGLNNSETGVDYQLILSAANNGSSVSGTNSVLSFGLRTAVGTYTVLGTRTSGGCSTTMTGNAVITVNQKPSVSITQVNDPCLIGAGSITITVTGGSPNYNIVACGATVSPSPTVGQYVGVTGSPATITTSGGATTFSDLPGNVAYKLTVTDNNGCIGQ
jgi:fibronectin-binding autotransporter adhesin